MIFIGICGASGSGKSTLADSLAAALGDRCLVLQQDCYYKDHSNHSSRNRGTSRGRSIRRRFLCRG